MSVIDGQALSNRHQVWRSPEVCRALSAQRLLKDWLYRGCFEVLVLHEISTPCVIACMNFASLVKLASTSAAVASLINLEEFHQSVKRIVKEMDGQYQLDHPTGTAIGDILNLVSQFRTQAIEKGFVNRFVGTVLENFQVPGRQNWSRNKEFAEALRTATDLNHGLSKIEKRPQTPPPKMPAMGLFTPPNTGMTSILQSSTTYGSGGTQRNRVFRLKNMSSAAAGGIALNSASNKPHITAPPSSEFDTSGSEADELSDIVGSDEALWRLAGAVRPSSDAASDASSITLGRRASPNTGRKMPAAKQSGALPKVLWKKVGRHDASNKGKQLSLEQAMVKAWLDEAEEGANSAERGNSSTNAIVID
ncbi:MAG: hypothetical protein Q9159_005983 [Coniocarpon cinnabarinum]